MEKKKVKASRCPECNSAKTYVRRKKSPGLVCINCGKFTSTRREENVVSSGECSSCGGVVKDSECQKCGSEKLPDGTFVYEKKDIKVEKRGGGSRREEGGKKKIRENKAIKIGWDKAYYCICECGEKVRIEESVERSWWDGVEWVVCPNCGERKEKDFLEEIKKNE